MQKLLIPLMCLFWLSGCARSGGQASPGTAAIDPKQEIIGAWNSEVGIGFEFQKNGTLKPLTESKKIAQRMAATYKWADETHIVVTFKDAGKTTTDRAAVRFQNGKLYLKGEKESRELVLTRAPKE